MDHRFFKKDWKVIALVALAAMSLFAFGCGSKTENVSTTNPNPANLNPTGSIQGTLTDSSTGEPIVGAVVDIGVGSATTNQNGVFTIMNVPATTQATGDCYECAPHGYYVGTIDLRNVTGPIRMNDSSYTGFRYPNFITFSQEVVFSSFDENKGGNAPGSGSGSNHDTPITGLMATCSQSIGKLGTSIDVLVVNNNASRTPVGPGYTVTVLYGGGAVATGTTDNNSRVLFSRLMARTSYLISAVSSDKSKFGDASYTTPVEGKTLTLSAQSSTGSDLLVGPPIQVSTTDQYPPKVVSTAPGNNADLAMPQDNLCFLINFTEPINNTTAYATALTPGAAAGSGLWNDVVASFNGAKAGNVVHSLLWNSNTQLAVCFPPLSPSSKYSVTLQCNALKNLKDVNGNTIDGFTGSCPDVSYDKLYSFTTNATGAATAPTNVVVVNASSIDYNSTTVNLDWPPASGALAYNIYRSKVVKLGGYAGTEVPEDYKIINTTAVYESQSTDTFPAGENFVQGQNQVFYRYKVVSLNSDKNESATSDFVTAADTVAPGLAAPTASFRTDYADGNDTLDVVFNEPVDEVSAEVEGNYSVWGFNGTTQVTVTKAFMKSDRKTVTLTLDLAMDNNTAGTFRPLVWPHVKAGENNSCNTGLAGGDNGPITDYPAASAPYQFVCGTVDNVLNPLPTPGAGDVLLSDNTAIVAGADGICNTAGQANLTIVHAAGLVSPEYICITSGTDLDLDSSVSPLDVAVYPVVVTVNGVKDVAGIDIAATRNEIGTAGPAQ